MEIKAKLTELAAESLAEGLFLIDVVVSSRNASKITVIIDGDRGVTIDDCGRISADLSKKLDEMNFGEHHYVLEVTTPGLDHPLKLKRQFVKNVNRPMKVHRADKSILLGKLVAADGDNIILKQESKNGKTPVQQEVAIPFAEIEKAFVLVSFK